jgi:hypothetical protein
MKLFNHEQAAAANKFITELVGSNYTRNKAQKHRRTLTWEGLSLAQCEEVRRQLRIELKLPCRITSTQGIAIHVPVSYEGVKYK